MGESTVSREVAAPLSNPQRYISARARGVEPRVPVLEAGCSPGSTLVVRNQEGKCPDNFGHPKRDQVRKQERKKETPQSACVRAEHSDSSRIRKTSRAHPVGSLAIPATRQARQIAFNGPRRGRRNFFLAGRVRRNEQNLVFDGKVAVLAGRTNERLPKF